MPWSKLRRKVGLERGRAEGIEQGLERGKVEGSLSMLLNLVHQGLLTSEVASQQLGMTVSEFEELLKVYRITKVNKAETSFCLLFFLFNRTLTIVHITKREGHKSFSFISSTN